MNVPQHVHAAFHQQLTEVTAAGLAPHSVETAIEMLSIPRGWYEWILVDIHLSVFLERRPHLKDGRNLPTIRRAILTDLKDRGIL